MEHTGGGLFQSEFPFLTAPSAQPAPFSQSLGVDGAGIIYTTLGDPSEVNQSLSQSSSDLSQSLSQSSIISEQSLTSTSSDLGDESAHAQPLDSESNKPGSQLLALIAKHPEKGIPLEGVLTARALKNIIGIWKCHMLTPQNHVSRKITAPELEFWAREISALYPAEDPRKFFVAGKTVLLDSSRGSEVGPSRPGKRHSSEVVDDSPTEKKTKRLQSKGILHDAIQNYRKVLRKDHPVPRYGNVVEPPIAPEPVPIVDAEELRQFLSLVKSTTNDKSALLWAWKQTLRQRKEFMSAEGRTIKQILAEYPSLHANWGFELLNQDFASQHSHADADGLLHHWSKLSAAVLKLAEKATFPKDLDADTFKNAHVELRPLLSMILLLKPITLSKNKNEKEKEKEKNKGKDQRSKNKEKDKEQRSKNKEKDKEQEKDKELEKTWRPSQLVILEGVFKHAPNITDVSPLIEQTDIDNKATTGRTQPYVIIVGPHSKPLAFYVVIENVKYLFHSVLTAVDVCFKAFWALDIEYPLESERFYNLLQHFCYKIKVHDFDFGKITRVASEIDKELNPTESVATK